MREIVFRGKRIDNGNWVYGFLADYIAGIKASINLEYMGVVDETNFYCVDPYTVGQYTGLTDKNGKRIFEGDILQFGERRLMVWWNGEAFQWQTKSIRGYDVIPYEISDGGDWTNIELGNICAEIPITGNMTTEVIGNIHDNPELLEVSGNG